MGGGTLAPPEGASECKSGMRGWPPTVSDRDRVECRLLSDDGPGSSRRLLKKHSGRDQPCHSSPLSSRRGFRVNWETSCTLRTYTGHNTVVCSVVTPDGSPL